jgi:hypothetical protein
LVVVAAAEAEAAAAAAAAVVEVPVLSAVKPNVVAVQHRPEASIVVGSVEHSSASACVVTTATIVRSPRSSRTLLRPSRRTQI